MLPLDPGFAAVTRKGIDRYGRLDVLVNNAGVGGGGRIADTTTRAFDEVINVNLRGTFFCCRAGFKQMKKQEGESSSTCRV